MVTLACLAPTFQAICIPSPSRPGIRKVNISTPHLKPRYFSIISTLLPMPPVAMMTALDRHSTSVPSSRSARTPMTWPLSPMMSSFTEVWNWKSTPSSTP